MIKALIFDCFGVLVGKGFEYTYRQAGGDPLKDRDFINDQLGRANLGMVSHDEFSSAMADKLNISQEAWSQSIRHAELQDLELLEYIEALHQKYKIGMLSNSNKGVIESKIDERWLKQCFDVIIISAEVGLVKPNPEIYQLTADRLGVETDECIFVDDRKSFTDAASDLGMKSIVYKDIVSLKKSISSFTNPKS
jgi:HAD superfamily hydrolase (TIGR01509 family)